MRTPIKHAHRALFLALQADAKTYPGKIRALADDIGGLNGNSLANALNPDHDAHPPSMATLVEIIVLAQGQRTVRALAELVGQVPVDIEALEARDPKDAVRLFLGLVGSSSTALGVGSEAARDGHFCPKERRELEPLLLALMKSTAELLQCIRGAG